MQLQQEVQAGSTAQQQAAEQLKVAVEDKALLEHQLEKLRTGVPLLLCSHLVQWSASRKSWVPTAKALVEFWGFVLAFWSAATVAARKPASKHVLQWCSFPLMPAAVPSKPVSRKHMQLHHCNTMYGRFGCCDCDCIACHRSCNSGTVSTHISYLGRA